MMVILLVVVKTLKKILGGRQVRNGFAPGDNLDIAFNGAGCMAAAIVAGLKQDIGGVYIFPHDHEHEEYEYFITIKHDTIIMACVGHGELLFCGPVDSFDGKNVQDDEEDAILEYELAYVTGVDTTKLLE